MLSNNLTEANSKDICSLRTKIRPPANTFPFEVRHCSCYRVPQTCSKCACNSTTFFRNKRKSSAVEYYCPFIQAKKSGAKANGNFTDLSYRKAISLLILQGFFTLPCLAPCQKLRETLQLPSLGQLLSFGEGVHLKINEEKQLLSAVRSSSFFKHFADYAVSLKCLLISRLRNPHPKVSCICTCCSLFLSQCSTQH